MKKYGIAAIFCDDEACVLCAEAREVVAAALAKARADETL